jgi:hypothetical protein
MRKISEITINGTPLRTILDEHKKWLNDEGGTRADLSDANLSDADLSYAKLSDANLSEANLSDANLNYADLRDADLSDADLNEANLCEANLSETNLSGANLDYSCWPLWCGSKNVKVDVRIAAQLAAHFCVLDCDDPAYIAARAAILDFARTSHRAEDLGLIE